MGIVQQHIESAVPCGGLELEIGGAEGSGIGTKCMAHVVRAAIGDVRAFKGLVPGLFDVDAAKGCFTGKDEGFLRVALLMEVLEFGDDGVGKGDAAGAAVFGFFDVGDFAHEVNVSPF